MAETVDVTTLGLKVDATSVDGASNSLGRFKDSAKQAEKQADDFVKAAERQAAVLGKSRSQTLLHDAATMGLTRTQMEQVRAATRAIDQFEHMERVKARLTNAARALGAAIGLSVVAGLVAMVAVLSKSAAAAAEAEMEQKRLEGALRATGHAAGLTAKDIDDLSVALAKTTFFDDEGIKKAASEMLIFKNVQGETFKEGIKLSTDMAALYGGSVVDHVKGLGKALDDPAEGLMMLERSFGKLSPRMKDHVKELVESNRLGEAQAIVLEHVRSKVGGVAEAMNTGLTAQTRNLKKEWGDMLEDLGKTEVIGGNVAKALDLMRQVIAQIREEINGTKTPLREFSDDITKWMGLTGVFIRYLQDLRNKKPDFKPHTAANLGAPQGPSVDPAAAAAAQADKAKSDASYVAYLKLQKVMKETQSDLAKEQAVVLEVARAWEKLSGEDLKKAEAEFGNVGNAVKKALAEMPRAKKSQEEYNQALENANRIVAEASGRSGDFEKNLKSIDTALKAGEISTLEYALAWGFLVYTQTDFGKAVLKLNEDMRRLSDDAIKEYRAEITGMAEDVQKQIQAMDDEEFVLERGEAALYRKQAAMLEYTRAMEVAEGGDRRYIKVLDDQIAALKRLETAATKKAAQTVLIQKERMEWEKLRDAVNDLGKAGNRIGDILAGSFGKAGSGLAKLTDSLTTFGELQGKIALDIKEGLKDAYENQAPWLYYEALDKAAKETAQGQLKLYGDMAAGAKSFFKEGTSGYKAMEAAERVFRAVELAMSVQSYVMKMAQIAGVTQAKVAGDTDMLASAWAYLAKILGINQIEGQSNAVVGVTNQAKGEPYSAWVRMAAMAASMAALGFAVSGGGGSGGMSTLGADRQRSQGTGTVLGDKEAKSESLLNALEILRDNSSSELLYQSRMLMSLRAIESGIKGMATFIARIPALTGRGDVPANQGGGWWSGGNAFSVVDAGISIAVQTVADAIAGIRASGYQDVERQHTGRFGLNSYSAVNRDPVELGQQFTRSLSKMIGNMADAIAEAASILTGRSAESIRAMLASIEISIEEMSFNDLRGDDIQAALGAVFGALGDQIVSGLADMFSDDALDALAEFQQVGEGAFQTLIRVASGVENARAQLALLHIDMIDWTDVIDKQGDVTTEIIRDSIVWAETVKVPLTALANSTGPVISGVGLIIQGFDGTADELVALYMKLRDMQVTMRAAGIDTSLLNQEMITAAGGISALAAGLDVYASRFFTAQEQIAASTSEVAAGFNRIIDPLTGLNLQMPTTMAGLRAMVEHYTSIGDSATVGAILALVPAWVNVQDAARDAAEEAHRSWMDVSDLLGQLNGETEAERNARHAGDYATQFARENSWATGMSFDQLIVQFQEMFKDQATWDQLTDSNKDLIRSMLGLAVDMRGVSDAVRNMDPAYNTSAGDYTSRNLSDFQRRFGGIINEQGSAAGSITLESQLIKEQIAANERRMAEINAQYQARGYLNPPEYAGLQTANNLYAEQLRALGIQLGTVTTLTAQYGQETGDAIYELDNWYKEQQAIIGDNYIALEALEKLYAERRIDIITQALEEINQAFNEMKKWRDALLAGDTSPLTAQQQLDAARAQYEAARGPGLALNATAEQQALYRQMADAYMAEAISFYGKASTEYGSIFNQIITETARFSDTMQASAMIDTTPYLVSIAEATESSTATLSGDLQTISQQLNDLTTAVAKMEASLVEATQESATLTSDAIAAAL